MISWRDHRKKRQEFSSGFQGPRQCRFEGLELGPKKQDREDTARASWVIGIETEWVRFNFPLCIHEHCLPRCWHLHHLAAISSSWGPPLGIVRVL